jgi:hypothetical protein
MIYRILADQQEGIWDEATKTVAWRPSGTRLRGVFMAGSSGGMGDIPFPQITNPRARFYFTELGWQTYGRFVYDSATQLGHTVRVIRRKNPDPSQVIYRDPYQVAILPRKRQR